IPGRIPILWDRHYGSQSKYLGLCGRGWETPGDIRLEVNPDGTVLFHDGSGAPSFFNSLPVETPVLEPVDGRLLQRQDGYYTVRLKEGLTYYFPIGKEPADRIWVEHLADPFGNTIHYLRDANGLREIHESNGRRIEVVSKQGRIEAMRLCQPGKPSQMLVRYSYDDHGNLTVVYDALDVPYHFIYRDNLLVEHKNRNGLSFYYEYDKYTAEGRCIHTWGDDGLYEERFIYHDAEKIVEATGTLGTTTFLYDERYLVLAETDPLGGVTQYEYDEYGRTTSVVDPDSHRTEYAYDRFGNLLKLIRPDGAAIATEFNTDSRPLRVTDPNGVAWKQEWDAKGELIRQISPLGAATQYRYDEYGQLSEFIDPLGNGSRFDFDAYGNLIRLTDAEGHSTQFNYDYLGRLITRIDPLQRRTSYQYDRKGRLIKALLPGGNTVSCVYDAEDNLISYTDENGAVTRLEYCGVNELKRRIQPDGQTVEYEYNQEEQLIAVINQRGERYELKRDPVGRIVGEVDYWGQSRKYRYSPAGYLQESTDPLGQTIRYKTDPLGRILEKILPGLPGTNQVLTESFQYDANGNLIASANREQQIKRLFDLEGKLLEEQQGPDCKLTFQYDLNGNRISRTTTLTTGATTRSQTVNYRYDSSGQATEMTIGERQPVQFTRNAGGQVIREVLGGQLKRWSEYNESGYLIRQTVGANSGPLFEQEYSYDKTGNLIKKSDSVFGTDKFFYDTMGRIERQIDPLGQVQKYLYDPAGDRLGTRIAETAADNGETDWSRIGEYDRTTYRFNRAGNLVSRTGAQETTKFIWDANQRLVASFKDGQQTTYCYDPLGRRISKTTAGDETRFYWDGDALLGDLRFETKGKGETGVDAEPVCTSWREWVYYPGSFEPLAMVKADTMDKDNPQPERIYYYA
ncbi:MAG TPA: DUF6531 domain-containing protein, partial [Bacillota bacterium]|nr:DUF6531 domain-containing protein [Bacillota bacterium]